MEECSGDICTLKFRMNEKLTCHYFKVCLVPYEYKLRVFHFTFFETKC